MNVANARGKTIVPPDLQENDNSRMGMVNAKVGGTCKIWGTLRLHGQDGDILHLSPDRRLGRSDRRDGVSWAYTDFSDVILWDGSRSWKKLSYAHYCAFDRNHGLRDPACPVEGVHSVGVFVPGSDRND